MISQKYTAIAVTLTAMALTPMVGAQNVTNPTPAESDTPTTTTTAANAANAGALTGATAPRAATARPAVRAGWNVSRSTLLNRTAARPTATATRTGTTTTTTTTTPTTTPTTPSTNPAPTTAPTTPSTPTRTPLQLRTNTAPTMLRSETRNMGYGWLLFTGLAIGATIVWARRRNLENTATTTAPNGLTVLRRTTVGLRSELLVVDVGGQKLLLGLTPYAIQNLATLDEAVDLGAAETPANATEFTAALESVRDRFAAVLDAARTGRNTNNTNNNTNNTNNTATTTTPRTTTFVSQLPANDDTDDELAPAAPTNTPRRSVAPPTTANAANARRSMTVPRTGNRPNTIRPEALRDHDDDLGGVDEQARGLLALGGNRE